MTFFMNDGTFELAGAGVVDETMHLLDVEVGGAFVELMITRDRTTAEAAGKAAARTARDAKDLPEFAVLGEREVDLGGAVAAEVCARFRDDEGVVYQRRAHVVAGGGTLSFELRARYEARDAGDVVMNGLLASLRLREGD